MPWIIPFLLALPMLSCTDVHAGNSSEQTVATYTAETDLSETGIIGDACQLDEECQFPNGFCLSSAEMPRGYCTMACIDACPDQNGRSSHCVRVNDGTSAGIGVCAASCGGDDLCRVGYSCRAASTTVNKAKQVCWRK